MNEEMLREIIRSELKAFFSVGNNLPPHNDLFSDFWKEYPRKVGKKKAKDVWDKLSPSKKLALQIIAAVVQQKRTVWKGLDIQYIPHATTWLNRWGWEDEIPEPAENDVPQIRKPTEEELALIKDN